MKREQRKLSRSEKKLFIMAGLAIAFILAFGAWRSYTDNLLKVEIPAPSLPAINAFTIYTTAGNSLINSSRIHAVFGDAVPVTSQNTTTAATTMNLGPEGFTYRPATSSEKIAIVRANLTALQMLRTGLTQEYREPLVRSLATPLPYYSTFQKLAELLVLQGQVAADRGDKAKAIQCFLQSMQFGAHISKGATSSIIALSYGYRFQYFGQKELWKDLHNYNLSQTRLAIAGLEELDAMQPEMSSALQEYKWFIQASLLELFEDRKWPIYLSEMKQGGCVPHAKLYDTLHAGIIGRGLVLREFTELMDKAVVEAKRPASLRRDLSDKIHLTYGLQPNLKELYFVEMRSHTRVALLRAALALHAHRLDYGVFPKSLSNLTPKYIRSIPTDSFNAGQPLKYKLTKDGYLLYAIGPDKFDDQGKAIIEIYGNRKYYAVSMDSKGDFVAGINH